MMYTYSQNVALHYEFVAQLLLLMYFVFIAVKEYQTLGSPKIAWKGNPLEPKGPHGRGSLGTPLGAQGAPWHGHPLEPKGPHGRGTFGNP